MRQDGGSKLTEYYIGAGGWAYFQIPGIPSLAAYSKAFNFVEVNSTFYDIPWSRDLKRWRRIVPASFHFSVRAHHSITHIKNFQPSAELIVSFEKMLGVCAALNADVLHLLFPPSFDPEKSFRKLDELLGSVKTGKIRLALEIRDETGASRRLPGGILKVMQDRNILHSVDLLKGEAPAVESDMLYSRLFGKGPHNIYQPDDHELLMVDKNSSRYGRTYIAFHGGKMYTDAARLITYKKKGIFPQVTKTTGLKSLESVLKEDSIFPSTKKTLENDQGWKLFDIEADKRVRVGDPLKKLPERTYESLDDVIGELKKLMGEEHG